MSIYEGCAVQRGMGDINAPLYIVVESYKFAGANSIDKNMLGSLLGDLKIDTKNVYVTPFDRNGNKTNEEYANIIFKEVDENNPKMIWILTNEKQEPASFFGINMPIKLGFGLYYPFRSSERFCLLVPNAQTIGKMNDEDRHILFNRMHTFAKEWSDILSGNFEPEQDRRSDFLVIKNFAKEKGYHYDKELMDVNSYYVIYSEKVGGHVVVVPTTAAKKDFLDLKFAAVFDKGEILEMKNTPNAVVERTLKFFQGG